MRVLLSLFFLTVPTAFAQSDEALALYRQGAYQQAVALAKAENGADSLAFAARALLAEGIAAEPVDMGEARLDLAQSLAERAMALDHHHSEARLQQAIILSLRARRMSLRAAYKARLGQRARALGEAAVEETPDYTYAHGFLAVWHVEVIRRGGRIGATVLGASMDEARAHYQRAAALSPDDPALHWQWARALAAKNPSRHETEIKLALERAQASVPTDQLAEVLQARAQQFSEAMAWMSQRQIRRMAVSYL